MPEDSTLKSALLQNIENTPMEGKCPLCSAPLLAFLGQVAREETINCKKCDGAVKLEDHGGKAREMLAGFEKIDFA